MLTSFNLKGFKNLKSCNIFGATINAMDLLECVNEDGMFCPVYLVADKIDLESEEAGLIFETICECFEINSMEGLETYLSDKTPVEVLKMKYRAVYGYNDFFECDFFREGEPGELLGYNKNDIIRIANENELIHDVLFGISEKIDKILTESGVYDQAQAMLKIIG